MNGGDGERIPASVVVTVGTASFPFDRLMTWVEETAQTVPAASWFIQHGYARAPHGLPSEPFIGHDQFEKLLAEAVVVICHCGPGAIVDSLRKGTIPLVVPRDPALGEHVDDHQLRYAKRVSHTPEPIIVRSQRELSDLVGEAMDDPDRFRFMPPPEDDEPTASAIRFGKLIDELFEA